MSKVRTWACALVFFGSLVLFASGALAQLCTCTPVVFAFRHAEDTNPPNPNPPKGPPYFSLTPTGKAHANLYATMVPAFAAAQHYCAVTRVYATTKKDKDPKKGGSCGTECKSATNAFDTATPLARQVMSADPVTIAQTVDKSGKVVAQYELYEYLDNFNLPYPPHTPSYTTPAANALRTELLEYADVCQSSAIFWTSQGFHILGGALINGTSNIPDKLSHFDKEHKPDGPAPPRNAAYVFEPLGFYPNYTGFSDTPVPPPDNSRPLTGYVQCYNHIEYTQGANIKAPQFIPATGSPSRQLYYCGVGGQSNLGGSPPKACKMKDPTTFDGPCDGSIPENQNAEVQAKICGAADLSPNQKKYADTFGACN
jgi:hypothetical protein